MGRAIDMENQLEILKDRVVKLEKTLTDILDTVTVKTNIDLTETESNEKEKTNNERGTKGSRKSNTRATKSKNKNS